MVLQVLAIGTGAAVAGLTGRRALEAAHPGMRGGARGARRAARWPAWGCCSGPPFLRRLLRLAAPDADSARRAAARSASCSASRPTSSAWLGYGVALWLLARGLLPRRGWRLRLAIAVFTASYLAGFLALFAPGGLGVREGLFILDVAGPARDRGGDRAGGGLPGAAHDHRVRGRRPVPRLPAGESACRTLSRLGRRPFEPRRPALVAVATFLLAALTLCWPMLAGRWLLGDDQYVGGYGFRLFGAEMFRADRARSRSGTRISSAACRSSPRMHGDIFYPTAWLRWFLPIDTAMNLGLLRRTSCWRASTMYAFLRALRVSWTGALVGGLAYELTGIVASLVRPGHDGKLFVSALAPLVLLALLRAIRDRRPGGLRRCSRSSSGSAC